MFRPEIAGGSRSENLAAHTLQEFQGVSSLPRPQSFICVIIIIKYEGKINTGQKKKNQPILIKSEPGKTVGSN